ncbi:DUF262 domain-containing protein [Photobacterium sp. BZF1]|uniref:DUF262 domain-containing protein n=1 Tax=Photobacterium sp. BZF1 TaxID=1904457 RepID=UPI00165399BA|nr:DUF262 domain-containing protein [Photobacterium sp. BZF1]MBC7001560.1 DUF262 domain-containing protein [Photobacterium sp. BZF1]
MMETNSHPMVTIENLLEEYQTHIKSVEADSLKGFVSKLKDIVYGNNTLILKSISELLQLNFFVDDYQRGYKWQKDQVEDLLNDIDEFEQKGADFYCLQPVVVKYHSAENADSQSRWELIDGQQRITTVFMILSYLDNKRYKIDYQTRESSSEFLQNYLSETLSYKKWDDFVSDRKELDNVDNYHFYEAYKAIHQWFEDKCPEDVGRKKWLAKLLDHTKVIWYAARDEKGTVDKAQSIDIFMRINSGKIPLTDAELIKALFLNHVVDENNLEWSLLKQSELAQQWDMIEHGLQNEEFWAFLSPKDRLNNKTTRIELLFDLLSGNNISSQSKQTNTHDSHAAFRFYHEQLKDSKDVHELWHKVKQGYYRLLEWYNDDDLYHLVGFLITRDITSVQALWALAEQKTKSSFAEILKSEIAKTLRKDFKQDNESLQFDNVSYDSTKRQTIISLLMLLNIDVHRKNKTRLSFRLYRETQWDIEHIHAQQSKDHNNKQQFQVWKDELHYISESGLISSDTKAELEQKLAFWQLALQNKDANCNDLRSEYLKSLGEVVGEFDDESLHSLDNLCLLPAKVNRGIGNHIFSMKRQLIINYEKLDGQYIPLATKNVFSKYYSESVSQMHKWSENDREAYRNALITSFKYYLGEEMLS